MAKRSTKNNDGKKKAKPFSASSLTKHTKKGKGRNYYANVGDNNGTVKKSIGEKKKFERKEPKLYDEGEVWSKAKKKKMRKLNARQRSSAGTKRSNIDSIINSGNETKVKPITEQSPKKKKKNKDKEEKKKNENSTPPKKEKTSNDMTETKKESKHANLFGGSNAPSKMSDLQKSFLDRLSGSRFRILNEELYTKPSIESFERFQNNPELFEQYHEGFRTQVVNWPVNPVDVILEWILNYMSKVQKTKKGKKNTFVVADFGCGDAKLAKEILAATTVNDNCNDEKNIENSVKKEKKSKSKKEKKNTESKTNVKVHSFDLVSGGNPLITACDMANVPLPDNCVDVAVFSLALMGTNVADFISEAHRIMCRNGKLKIAEVRSRFESTASTNSSSSKNDSRTHGEVDESSLTEFVNIMGKLGFVCKKMDRSNQMFVMFDFEKNGKQPEKDIKYSLRPCIYKRR